ncbi:MAG: isoleucine--tRNA ligase [Bacteroidales bacterium]|nr:isoleucine--tRNA ligase [Bacteroidales bacterium]
MSKKFPEYKSLDLSQINKDILKKWEDDKTFEKSISFGEGKKEFIFYEGPPSANGMPGIHHVISRTLKDTFCRYKTLQGYQVKRKAGWDTHGLPVELAVEKKLGITKDDIGSKISIKEYNDTCRKEVMKYTQQWEDITKKMGYWVDMENPYITYDNKYIESVWWLLKQLYNKGLLYKGYTIQPYSPAAGTGLSSHELNMPGCYKDVKDSTGIAQFKTIRNEKSDFLFKNIDTELFFLAWTTTPWTLLSNTALATGAKIIYLKIRTFNPYTGIPITVIIAKDLYRSLFPEKNDNLKLEDYKKGDKNIPFKTLDEIKGKELAGISYEQLLPYKQPVDGDAFKVLNGDFVTTSEGTGIVHIAPSFGSDDYFVAKKNGIGSLTLVNKKGEFVDEVGEFSGRPVKNSYDSSIPEDTPSVDVDILVKLKQENKLFKSAKYEHSYPHCWRTDKPILYYPLDSWFIKSTAAKDKMIELNKTINWQPPATGEGRFGQWLENLIDWNLSRSRYWGTPLPIWRTEDKKEEICIGSLEELKKEAEKAVLAGFMKENPLKEFIPGDFSKENYLKFDIHRPTVDDVILVSASGKKMFRETDLIDVWFDSGAMPYAQHHYPFENKEEFRKVFPADYIAEGVDQTRGWFFTLHAISTMLFDSVAFKNIIATGLLQDKNGVKMSKRLGNVIDPFETIEKHGSDPVRWYMLTNARPWDNLKFDLGGVDEVKRKFFGTLYNTYSFFSLYANLDGFSYKEKEISNEKRPEIDKWVLSLLNTLIKEVETAFNNYEPTTAGRLIQNFVIDNLSNWYVRLNRKRFWGQDYNADKTSAYQTLYTCLETVAKLMSPIAPFYSDHLFSGLNSVTGRESGSVHLSSFPVFQDKIVDKGLEERMELAQQISSMSLSLRRKSKIKVRQPLQKIMIPVLNNDFQTKVEAVEDIILSEINVKEIEYLKDSSGIIVKNLKPDFRVMGKKYGKLVKNIAQKLSGFSQENINKFEQKGCCHVVVEGETIEILINEVQITTEDIPGLLAVNKGNLTVALDTTITDELKSEGIAREIVNKVQNIRKDSGFEVTDNIIIEILSNNLIDSAVLKHEEYIKSQVLAEKIKIVASVETNDFNDLEIEENVKTEIKITKKI